MPFWYPSDRTYVKVVRVKINDTNVVTIFRIPFKQTDDGRACKPEPDHTTSSKSRSSPPPPPPSPTPPFFFFPPVPVHERTSSATSGWGSGQVGPGTTGTEGDCHAGWFSLRTSTRVVPLLTPKAGSAAGTCAAGSVCVHQSHNLSSCVWFYIHVVWGLLSCCIFSPCQSSHLVIRGGDMFWSDGCKLLFVSCSASAF